MRHFNFAAVFAAVCLSACAVGSAQVQQKIFIPDDALVTNSGYPQGYTHTSANVVAIVGFTMQDMDGMYTGPTSPTLAVGADGSLDAGYYELYNASQILMNGAPNHPATIYCAVNTNDTSMLTVGTFSSAIGAISLQGSSSLTVSGGTVGSEQSEGSVLTANSNSNFTLSSGTICGIAAQGSARGTISGGSVAGSLLSAGPSAIVSISGGTVTGNATAANGGILKISGGMFSGGVNSVASGNVIISGGQITGGLFSGGGSFDFQAGVVDTVNVLDSDGLPTIEGSASVTGDVSVSQNGSLTVSGGTVAGDLSATGSGTGVDLSGAVIQGSISTQDAYLHLGSGIQINGDVILSGQALCNMDDGTVSTSKVGFRVQDHSTAFINGGKVGFLTLNNNALVYVSGGNIGGVFANDSSSLFMAGGTVSSVEVAQSVNSILNGGNVTGNVQAENSANLTLAGAIVGGNLITQNSSIVTLTGGAILGNVMASDSSTIDVESLEGIESIVGTVTLTGNAKLLFEGVPIPPPTDDALTSSIIRAESATAQAGPTATPLDIYIYDNASVEIDGVNLSASLIDPDSAGRFSEYQLTGDLQDGTALAAGLDLFVENGSAASFQLVPIAVPEPASLGLLCGLALLSRRPLRREASID